MAWLAQWLPIATRPEQLHVALMRNDMVYYGGNCGDASVCAHDAQHVVRMAEEVFPRLLPLIAISTLSAGLTDGYWLCHAFAFSVAAKCATALASSWI